MDKIEVRSYKDGKHHSTIDIVGWTAEEVGGFYKFQKRRGYTCRMKRRLNGLKKRGGDPK